MPFAPVAQLDRAPGYEPGGREFESLRARHNSFVDQLFRAHNCAQTVPRRAPANKVCWRPANLLVVFRSRSVIKGNHFVFAIVLLTGFSTFSIAANLPLPPGHGALKNEVLGQNDVEIRIHFLGSLFLDTRWLILRNSGGQSDATFIADTGHGSAEGPKKHLKPREPWDLVWKQLESDGFYKFTGNSEVPNCTEAVPMDADEIDVEFKRAATYRAFSYYAPQNTRCGESRKFLAVLRYLNSVFGKVFPESSISGE